MLSRVNGLLGVAACVGVLGVTGASAQPDYAGSESIFAPIPWPDHGEVRLASGMPGPDYWQQRADYEIDVTLDTENTKLIGSIRCTYTNNSNHELRYLWVNLDQNAFNPESIGTRSMSARLPMVDLP